MIEVKLTQGQVAYIDEEDAYLLEHKWQALRSKNRWVGAVRKGWNAQTKKRYTIYMHREITGALPGEEVDHEDRNVFNNIRSNLRRTTHHNNLVNKVKYKNNTSGYKGVFAAQTPGKWYAKIGGYGKGGTQKRLGTCNTKEEAARLYDAAALERWGEFAQLNFPNT